MVSVFFVKSKDNDNNSDNNSDNNISLIWFSSGFMCPCVEGGCDQYGVCQVNINSNKEQMGGLILCYKHLTKYFSDLTTT